MIPAPALLFLKNLPWGKIALVIAVCAAIFAVVLYIRNAEENRASVVTLKNDKAELTQANADLEAAYKNQISVLQSSLQARIERERSYNDNIKEIQAAPDASCARSSPPIRASLRLLRNRPSD